MEKDTAIVTYVDNDVNCLTEIFWLYRSWLYSGSDVRSDLIIFYNPSIYSDNLPKGKGVILHPLKPIYETVDMWKDYPRINNTWFLLSDSAKIILNYKYTFRTDVDVFLTHNFVNLKPRLATFGINLYESYNREVADKIRDLCEKWGIRQYNMNVDCHIMANSSNILEYVACQYDVACRLKKDCFKEGHGEWPRWYEYVINMYSAGIAANAYYGMGYNLGGLSCMSMSDDPIGSNDYSIHAWHTEQNFSKLKWRQGYYDIIDFDALDDNIINSYCTKIAGRRNFK